MILFKTRQTTEVIKKITALIVILAVFVVTMFPKPVKAGPIEVINALVGVVTASFGDPSFPVSGDRVPVKTINVVSTAYSSDVWQTDSTPCIPASGYDLCVHYEKYGEGDTIAANFLPLGTKVKIPKLYGNKVFVVRDRMNARYGYGRIDIWMPTYKEAKNFGVQRFEMEVF